MSPENFCYWLQGFIEERKLSADPGLSLNTGKVEVIEKKLAEAIAAMSTWYTRAVSETTAGESGQVFVSQSRIPPQCGY